ncbi:hypothetical protein SAMN05216353_12942 [Halobacillus alkaliphilus]|uniref:Uncharacterized protein n=1 Tax=Halobacillus alkaliphilus TaxID=396056 RepID=A0A1I2QDR6_9BACI|nr:hypothetical protein SAMN05216353_12942 [Halobacillus alkaliphilus]
MIVLFLFGDLLILIDALDKVFIQIIGSVVENNLLRNSYNYPDLCK